MLDFMILTASVKHVQQTLSRLLAEVKKRYDTGTVPKPETSYNRDDPPFYRMRDENEISIA